MSKRESERVPAWYRKDRSQARNAAGAHQRRSSKLDKRARRERLWTEEAYRHCVKVPERRVTAALTCLKW